MSNEEISQITNATSIDQFQELQQQKLLADVAIT